MAELTQKERLQPSLLDRLVDDEPEKNVESRDKRVLSLRQLRAAVLRDLAWLFNTSRLDALQDLEPYPEVRRSVLNYGIPDLTGHTASSIDTKDMERMLKQAVLDFEPRLLRESLRIKLIVNEDQMNHNAMTFNIEGQLWAQPAPLHILLRTELDLEAGDVVVNESSGGASAR